MAKFCLWKTLAVIVSVVLGIFISDSQAEKPYVPIQADPLLEPWRWRSFPELKGLGLNCLAEDRDGNMWFGLKGEIRRYDGTKWTVYTPEDGWTGKIVGKLLGARDGSVYAGTEMGISRFRDGQWARVFPLEGDLPWSAYSLIEGSDGSIWAGTLLGALRLSGETWTLYTSAEMAESVRKLAPYVKISIIPDEALPKKPWGAGVGAHFVPLVYAWDQLNDIPRVVVVVLPGGPAEKAGLRLGDRLMAMDGAPVQARVLAEGEGSSVKLTVQREGRPEPFELTVSQEQYEGTYRSTGVFDVYEDRDGGIWFGLITGEILRHVRSNEGAEVWQLYTEKDGLDTGNRP
ncbi:MAG: PDZ domain-containing protein, partial [bacterium]|nr:PDZ domain-containing protein [bacterium]